jgi:hypothetical protein
MPDEELRICEDWRDGLQESLDQYEAGDGVTYDNLEDFLRELDPERGIPATPLRTAVTPDQK